MSIIRKKINESIILPSLNTPSLCLTDFGDFVRICYKCRISKSASDQGARIWSTKLHLGNSFTGFHLTLSGVSCGDNGSKMRWVVLWSDDWSDRFQRYSHLYGQSLGNWWPLFLAENRHAGTLGRLIFFSSFPRKESRSFNDIFLYPANMHC